MLHTLFQDAKFTHSCGTWCSSLLLGTDVFLQLQATACSSLQTSLEKLTSVKKTVDTRGLAQHMTAGVEVKCTFFSKTKVLDPL